MHLDIVVTDVETEVQRLQVLGASRIDDDSFRVSEERCGYECVTPSCMSSASPPVWTGN